VTSTRTFSWFIAIVALSVLGFVMSATGAAQPFQSVAQRVAAPIESLVHRVAAPPTDFISNIGRYGRLRDENRALRTENERLRALLAQTGEDDTRARDLADLTSLANVPGGSVTTASVIARGPSPVRDLVAINRGTNDGVQEGMTVVGKGGALVGTIEVAHATVAWVRLISDPRSAVNALVQESRARAVMNGSTGRGLSMDVPAQDGEVRAGDTIVTSGLGGGYPAGLAIGTVARVDGGPLDTFRHLEVEPAVRLSSIESVAVLTGFHPTPVEGIGR
jgi:rod shape-determining protein MreC